MTPFVLSSFDSAPEHLLLGFCWAGADLVIGDEGYARYRAERAKDIAPGEDGAYVIVSRNGQEISIGTDFCGYAKLFLYRDGSTWAVSNSFYDLMTFVTARGLVATLDEPRLRTFMVSGHLGQQLMSLKTSVKQVELVPANCRIAVVKTAGGDDVKLVHSQAVEAIDADARRIGYRNALGKYLGTWIGRFKTMFDSALRIPIDLSGGRDSRAVLGLALLSCKQLGLPRDRFYVRSSVQKEDDFKVAQAIAGEFGLDLNRDSGEGGDYGESVYPNWKQHALGAYAPVYFFGAGMWRFSLTGGGGESHRPFYPAPDFNGVFFGVPDSNSVWKETVSDLMPKAPPVLARVLSGLPGLASSSADTDILRRDAHEGLASVRCGYESSLDEMVVHYRHYRDRFHFGYGAVERSNISPLASKSLRLASALCGKDQFNNAQVIADLMLACDRKLAAMPFDKSSKALSRSNIDHHTEPGRVMDHAELGGKVFGASQSSSSSVATPNNPVLQLVEDFEKAEERIGSTDLLPQRYVERARKTVARMKATGKRDRAGDYHATRVSHVVLAGELARMTGL